MKSRILAVFLGFILLWTMLILRAASLQIVSNDRLENLKQKQFQTVVTLQSRRGAIVDREGRDLALSTTAYSVFADPKVLEQKKASAKKLAKLLNLSYESIYPKLKDSKKRFVWIQRQIDKEKAEKIKSWEIRGIQVVEEFKRVYPNEGLLSSVLGFVGGEGQGLEGLELGLDTVLQGNKKKISVRRDARGRPLIADGLMFAENPDGTEVQLTIDSEIQYVLDNELKAAIENFEADSAVGVVLDAKTSEVLAMSSAPTFDANAASKASAEHRRNRAVTDAFEPGSTMKTFVIAAAMNAGILAPNTKYNTENGVFKVGDRIIREAEAKDKWQQLTVSEILAYSSNIGTTKIAFDLGSERLRKAMLDFGFGSRSEVQLPGEAKGTVLPLPWNPHLLSNISFGHGITASALQMANAYAAIANGGILNKPWIVRSIRDPDTGKLTEFTATEKQRVLTAETAASMRLILTGVTSPGGTGVNAKVDGFLVGGKTGTAQKADPNKKGYMPNAYISSFAGFIPANDPKYVIYVAVDHPKKNAYYGSQVAAPIFSRLAGYAVRKAGLAPAILTEKNLVTNAKTKNMVKKSVSRGDIALSLKDNQVPDLKNLTLREVLNKLSSQDLQVQVRGQGVVAEVEPTPGSPLPEDKKITVILK